MELTFRHRISALAWFTFLYVLLEWLFLVTKPSFLDFYSWPHRVEVLLIGALLLTVAMLFVFLIGTTALWAFERLLFPPGSSGSRLHRAFLVYLLAVLLLILGMLMTDNFSYTLFGWGIIDTSSFSRIIYCAFLLGMFIFISRLLGSTAFLVWQGGNRIMQIMLLLLLLAAFILLAVKLLVLSEDTQRGASLSKETGSDRPFPNVVLIASDGIEADHMSLYGYHRETTPNLDALASSMLLFENSFSNASQTTGAVTALLTGKYPARSKVFFPPQFLTRKDSYEHLPGIFKQLGYYNVQIAVSWWADSAELNFVDGFDVVNEIRVSRFRRHVPFEFFGVFQFLKILIERPAERIKHLLGIKRMMNPYREVMPSPRRWPMITDADRFEMLEEALDSNSAPFFLHLHLNDTHGVRCIGQDCEYDLSHRNFSLQHEEINSENRVDYYDDAVAEGDRALRKLLDFLQSRNLLDETIIVVYSDHSATHTLDRRIPLLIIFPAPTIWSGLRVHSNAQLLDVGPTLLDYMNIEVPAWMDGKSLLGDDLDPSREIFGVGVIPDEGGEAPGYGLLQYALIVCQRHYLLTLATLEITSNDVIGHTTPCAESDLLSHNEARKKILRHLGKFDIQHGTPAMSAD